MTHENHVDLGKKLGEVRRLHGTSLAQLAHSLGVTKSYLSKVENGHKPVSQALLQKYALVYSQSAKFAELIGGHKVIFNNKEGGPQKMDSNLQVQPPTQEVQMNLNPDKTPVLYTDWQNVNANDGGVTLSFGQVSSPVPAGNIVARLGMSHAQAKQFHQILGDTIDKYIDTKKMEF